MATNSFLTSIPKLKGRENYDWAFAAENLLILEGKAGSTKDLWQKLKSMFDDSGFSRRITLLRNLISIRLDGCDSMTTYITQIIETAQKLADTGFPVNDEWIGCLLLAGLPDKYFPMNMAIEHSGIAITVDVIKTKLIDLSDDSSEAGNAFFSREEQNQQYVIKATNAFSAVFLSGNYCKNDFYLDSGASVHMTPNVNIVKNPCFTPQIKEIIAANKISQRSAKVHVQYVVKESSRACHLVMQEQGAASLWMLSMLMFVDQWSNFNRWIKWDSKSRKHILVGFAENVKGYRVYDPVKCNIKTSRDVIVHENTERKNTVDDSITVSVGDTIQNDKSGSYVESSEKEIAKKTSQNDECSNISSESEYLNALTDLDSTLQQTTASEEDDEPELEVITKRIRKPPERYGFTNQCASSSTEVIKDPVTIHGALEARTETSGSRL
ncbi:hypothetical protein EVAR_96048_1 [Eumeta japonica]|uniref:Retroviral polymerase SH3-like domain-containing protein n=1 Tax=Eumeta variegata TaxID=151549 RepID=A0A4C1W7V5_EUMVA|nr:hypothetical protein EVAR_96048_1 [Eumeta japonica]